MTSYLAATSGTTLGRSSSVLRLKVIRSNATQVEVVKVSSTTGILGYRCEKWVKIVRYALALLPTSMASDDRLCFFARAS